MSVGEGTEMSWYTSGLGQDCCLQAFTKYAIFPAPKHIFPRFSAIIMYVKFPFLDYCILILHPLLCYLQKSPYAGVLVCKQLLMMCQCDISFSSPSPPFNGMIGFPPVHLWLHFWLKTYLCLFTLIPLMTATFIKMFLSTQCLSKYESTFNL